MGDEATNRPSPRAVARFAGDVGGEVADLRSSLRRALDEADRHTADGRPDRAAAVLADQQHLLEAVHRRLEERIAAAAVEREAEGVLAHAEDVADVADVADAEVVAEPRPAPVTAAGDDDVTAADEGQFPVPDGGLGLRILASAAAAVTGVVLLLVPNAGGTLEVAGLVIADGTDATAPATGGATGGAGGAADGDAAAPTTELQHVHLTIPGSAAPGPVLVPGAPLAPRPGPTDPDAVVPSLDVPLAVPDLDDVVGDDVLPADPEDLALDESPAAPPARDADADEVADPEAGVDDDGDDPDTTSAGAADEGETTSADDGTPDGAADGSDRDPAPGTGDGAGDGTDDAEDTDPGAAGGSTDLADPLIAEEGAGHTAG